MALLEPLGATVSDLPLIEITSPEDFSDLDQALTSLEKYDWMILASQNAVDHVLARAATLKVSVSGTRGLKLAAIGPATATELAKNGLVADFCPSSFLAEFLIEEFPGYPDLQGKKIFWPRTNIGRTLIADKLAEAGAQVDTAIAYVTGLPKEHDLLADQLVESLSRGQIDVITLASAQSARNLATLIQNGLDRRHPQTVEEINMERLLAPVKIAVIGPITATAARDELGKVDIEAAEYTLSGLTEALLASLKFR